MKQVDFTSNDISSFAAKYDLKGIPKFAGLFYYDMHYELQMVVMFDNESDRKVVLIQK